MKTLGRLLVGAALVQALPSVTTLGQWTRLRALPNDLYRWRGPDVPRVALTFDDGPDPETTPALLDRLDELGVRGTFFCLGVHAQHFPSLVKEAVARGHEIGVHGFAHDHHLWRTPTWVRRDLDAALDALSDCGVSPRWFRPPYGQASVGTLMAARALDLDLVHWSAWGREWEAQDAHAVADRVCASMEPGAIVLLHDSDDTSPTGTVARVIGALGPIVDELAHRGLSACTLSELVP
jgi:peptidoglycan/xylan/chitin deacetylase (PgdA/CDA1 family)